MSSNNEGLQYALLALTSGLEAYQRRTRENELIERKSQEHELDRDLRTRKTDAEIEGIKARSDYYRSGGSRRDKDPVDDFVKSYVRPEDKLATLQAVEAAKSDPDKSLSDWEEKLANTDKEYPVPDPNDTDTMLMPPEQVKAMTKARSDARRQRAGVLAALQTMHSRGLLAPAGGLGAATGARAGVAPQAGMWTGGLAGQPLTPQQQQSTEQFGPPAAAAGAGASPQAMQAQAQATGQVGPQTGGARVTPPRMPTQQIAQQNFQSFAQAPQGPGANTTDQRRAGELAMMWTKIMDPSTPFEEQAAAYFKLHDIIGTPIPEVFQQWAVGLGIPRSVIDAASGPQAVGSNWSAPESEDAMGIHRPRPEIHRGGVPGRLRKHQGR